MNLLTWGSDHIIIPSNSLHQLLFPPLLNLKGGRDGVVTDVVVII
jgi:hypothetical protein